LIADSEGSRPAATRLDVYLVRHGLARSRRQARDLITAGQVLVNGHRLRKSIAIEAGDRVEADHIEPPVLYPNPTLAVEILYQSEKLIAANKPGLMPCHPLRPGEHDTLMNAIAGRFPETARLPPDAEREKSDIEFKPLEGLLVHRLDNGTSGAVMIARTFPALSALRKALHEGGVKRCYTALVEGALTRPLQLRAPIAHHPRNPRRMVVAGTRRESERLRARDALTEIVPVRPLGRFTLVTAIPATGSRHQIRVHLAAAGHPIAGDLLYGGGPVATLDAARFFLHLGELSLAQSLCQANAAIDAQVAIRAPLATDLAATLSALGG